MDKLSREEILHVANLARIELTEEEIEKYQIHIKKLLDDIEKIKDVKGYDDEQLIAPWSENCILREDRAGNMLDLVERVFFMFMNSTFAWQSYVPKRFQYFFCLYNL